MASQGRATYDAAAIASRDLQVELIPGTEIMRDTEHSHFVHSQAGQVLVPQPTEASEDPLNWHRGWKYCVTLTQSVFVLVSVMTNLALAPMTPILAAYFNVSTSRVALYTGVAVLTLGYANFVLVPLANLLGRRPMSLICSALCIGCAVWLALAKSDGSFIAGRVVNGIGAAANESFMAMAVADVFFLHERGTYMGIYIFAYFGGSFIGPIISGALASRYGWQYFFWVCLALNGAAFLGLFFLFPETRYRRNRMDQAPSATVTSDAASGEKADSSKQETTHRDANVHVTTEVAALETARVGRGRPSRAQFNIIQPLDTTALKNLGLDFIVPVRLLFLPITFFAAFNMGNSANHLLAVTVIESAAFGAPPYNFSPSAVGLTNLALLGGGIIGLLTAGPFSDWLSAWSTKRNDGIREAEMRLPALIPYVIALIVGSVILGVGWRDGWDWPLLVVIGMGAIGLQVTAIPTIALSYAIDSYPHVAGEILVIATVAKNTTGFGMTYWIPDPYLASGDFFTPLMISLALTLGTALLAIPLYFFGQPLRRMTKNSSLHSL